MDTRYGRVRWGKGQQRVRTSDAYWKQPLRWNAVAHTNIEAHPDYAHVRPRVFCASLADWLDDEVPTHWLADLLSLIYATPNLDWLLLTKRPENWRRRVYRVAENIYDVNPIMEIEQRETRWKARDWIEHGKCPDNVWFGFSAEDQPRFDERHAIAKDIPCHILFCSAEPLLGPIVPVSSSLDWIIFGGESGTGARLCDVDWIRDGVKEAKSFGIKPFVKQLGSNVMGREFDKWVCRMKDKKGGEISEWSEDLQIRQFPTGAAIRR